MLRSLTFITVLIVTFASCKKDSSEQSAPVSDNEAITISEENAAAEGEYDDVTEIGLSAGVDLDASLEVSAESNSTLSSNASNSVLDARVFLFVDLRLKIGDYANVTVDPADGTFPKTVTIDFGDGCRGRDGKLRKGAIILHYSAPIRRPGAVLTVTFRNYYINRAHIEGKTTISNLSTDEATKYSVQVEGGKISWPNGRGLSYNGTKVVTQIEGMGTRTIRDDVYSLEGRSEIKYANGRTVTKNTETPLIKPVACKWFVEGVVKIKINDRTFYIDFGNGECDNKAIVKWANGEREISLRFEF